MRSAVYRLLQVMLIGTLLDSLYGELPNAHTDTVQATHRANRVGEPGSQIFRLHEATGKQPRV